ncbi:MAG: 2Fe-2S iron-sulfur cluster-binding protein [Chloroflexota bacterium]
MSEQDPAPSPAIAITIDGLEVHVPAGSTLLKAIERAGGSTPTLCYDEVMRPVNVCRVCVVELKGARALAPACSRKVEPGMDVLTDSPRVRQARRVVVELLGSTIDTSTAPDLQRFAAEYDAHPERFGGGATVGQPVRANDNELYVRDYGKCILCYKCVQACGVEAQFTFAIGVSGRGFGAHIDTGLDVPLPESPCVYCGNCVAVCPTGALMGRKEWDLRQAGRWLPEEQRVQETICPYCGVGCGVKVHIQEDRVVKVDSPRNHPVTSGFLCVKGRFGYEFVNTAPEGT